MVTLGAALGGTGAGDFFGAGAGEAVPLRLDADLLGRSDDMRAEKMMEQRGLGARLLSRSSREVLRA